MTEPRSSDVGSVGPAGAAAGAPAVGSGSSGRPGRSAPVRRPATPRKAAQTEDLSSHEPPSREPSARERKATGTRATAAMTPVAVDTSPAQAMGQPVTYRPGSEAYPASATPRSRPVSSGGMSVDDVHPGRPRRGVRRARLRLTRIDPWSALKVSLVFAAFLFIVWIVAVIVLFAILSGAGVFSSVNSTLTDVFGTQVNFSGSIIVGGAAVIGALSVIIVTALGTIAAFAYNLTAGLLGGLDVTLTESD